MIVTGVDVADAARRWVGVPFLHQGRTRHGVDCVGLAIVVAAELELLPADFERRDYGRLPSRDELGSKLREHCQRLTDPLPGCLLAMRWNREAAHVAIYTGETIVHAYQRIGRVVEHGFRGRWLRFLDSAWEFPGVSRE